MRKAMVTCVCAAVLAAAACAEAQDRIVAVVNNEVITQKDLEAFTTFTRLQLSQKLEGVALEEKLASMRQDMVQRLIEDRLILQEAKKSGLKIDDSRVKAKMGEVKKRYETEKEFTEALLQQGLSEADVESRIRDQMLMYALIDMKVREKIRITPGEITEYYEQHMQELEVPEQRSVVSIAAGGEREAREFARQLRNGRDIEALAAEKNAKTSTMSAGRGELKKEIDEVVFGLSEGGVSDPIEVNGVFYVFKLKEIRPSRTPSLTEVQDQVSELLFQKKMQEDVASWLDGIKKKSYIRVME